MLQINSPRPSEDALAEARREGARAERRRLLVVWLGCVGLVLLLGIGSLALTVRAKNAAPGVITDIVSERRAALEQHLRDRRNEAVAIVADVFDFLGEVWLESEPVRRIRASVGGARAQLSQLDAELKAALQAPFSASGPLIQNGPTRARYLARQLVLVAEETRQLAGLVFQALADVSASFYQSDAGSPIPTVLQSMEALLNPFLGENQPLRARWDALKVDISAWGARVETDLQLARESMRGETLGQEFIERMARRIF